MFSSVCPEEREDHGVPVNHWSIYQSARDAVLAGIEGGNEHGFSGEIANALLKPQEKFFEVHRELVAGNPPKPVWSDVDERIAWTHNSYNEPAIRITCLNSALLSKKYEDQGKLYIPSGAVGDTEGFGIALVHHPLNWLDPWNAKELREKLHRSHRLIFTGHEHKGDVLEVSLAGSGTAVTVEAPVFSSTDGALAQGFSCVFFDAGNAGHQEFGLLWEGKGYVAYQNGSKIEAGQSLMPLSPLKGRDGRGLAPPALAGELALPHRDGVPTGIRHRSVP